MTVNEKYFVRVWALRSGSGHVVSHDCQDPPGPQDSLHLLVEGGQVQPVERLADGDQVQAVVPHLQLLPTAHLHLHTRAGQLPPRLHENILTRRVS